jgi:putative transcriptional regulator
MSIKYDKLFTLLKERGINTTRIRRDKIIGQGTLTAIKNGTGGLDAKTISKLCALLDCQPGDIMEYVPDERGTTVEPTETKEA